ncbi:hypothetical protein [Fictibacillus sp. JL2B1089]|uniref:hypothetical protein n=1 Tax=Fictibacillus sp. JL2B1089 TaxID=3399565 RepID=UPI003A858DD2
MAEINAYMNGYQPEGDTEFLSASLDAHKKALEKSQQKVKRMEKALEFYADDENWIAVNTSLGFVPCLVENDQGKIAKHALEAEEKE